MAENKKLHIVMFPWLALGHMIPYLELAKLFASKGHTVTYLSTPRNILRLPKTAPGLINFVELTLPAVENLPENAEATIDVPFNVVKYLKFAHDRLRQPIEQFLKSSVPKPDWIFFDFSAYWMPETGAELKIRTAFFSIFTASILGYFQPPTSGAVQYYRNKPEDFTVKPEWIDFETTACLKLFEIQRILVNIVAEDDENVVGDAYRLRVSIRDSDAMVIRSSFDFEPEWLNLLARIHEKTVIPSGMLPARDINCDCKERDWGETKEWLDKQNEGSVVYVAFGSETKPSQDELTEIAFGLELSGLPFYWVLIKRRGQSDSDLIELPEGFEERTRGRGIVCTGWAPQLKIVSHASVGGMLIHAGVSSVVEAFQFGRALMMLPFLGDQAMVARVLEEKKMAYQIPREETDGWFSRETVARALTLVMVEDGGKMYRDRAKELKPVFGDMGRQDECVESLLSYLQSHSY